MVLRKNLRKKGLTVASGLAAAAVAAAVIIAVISLIPIIGRQAEEIGKDVPCEMTLIKAQGLKTVAGKVVDKSGNPPTINCPVEFRDVHEQNIENPDSGVKSLNSVMSNDVLFCWNRFGTKGDLYDSSTGTYCQPCKVLTIMSEEKLDRFVQYLDSEGYTAKFGPGANVPQDTRDYYDFYSFGGKKKEIAIVTTWGRLAGEKYLIYNERKQTGLLLYPFDNIGDLNCYSFEGRLNPTTYKR